MAHAQQSEGSSASGQKRSSAMQPVRYAAGMALGLLAVKFIRRKLREARNQSPATRAAGALAMVPTVILGSALGAAAVFGFEHTYEARDAEVGIVLKEKCSKRKHQHHHGHHHHGHHHHGQHTQSDNQESDHGHHHHAHHHQEGQYHYTAAERAADLKRWTEVQQDAGAASIIEAFVFSK